MSDWKNEHTDLLTDSLWLIPRRGESTGDFHGSFVPHVPRQVIRRFTQPGETVLDLFCGLGTTLIECRRLGRHAVGVELNPEVAERGLALAQGTENPYGVRTHLLVGDSAAPETLEELRATLEEHGDGSADCVILHPPYHDIIRFGEDPRDLSNAGSLEEFLERFRAVGRTAHALLRPGRHLALVIGDRYAGGEWVPLGFECMRVLREEGLVLKAINVKDIQGNERGKGKSTNLWRYRALRQGLYVFKHEYVMLFQRRGVRDGGRGLRVR